YEARIAAAGRASAPLAEAERAARRLETRFAEESAVRWRPRRGEEIAALAARAEAAARTARAAIRSADERRGRDLLERRRALAERLAAVEPLAASDRELRSPAQQARIDLATSAAAFERGDLAAVDSSLRSAERDLDDLDRRLERSEAPLEDLASRRRWQSSVDSAIAGTLPGGAAIVVDKARRRGFLIRGGRVELGFVVELSKKAMARKLWEGDGATPEGVYRIVAKKDAGESRYHRALLLDYPNADDRRAWAEAARHGRAPRRQGPGGLIEIHGAGGRGFDWTNGCVALSNADIDRLFPAVAAGTPVVIVPTAVLKEAAGSR
ncbi:MAG TPA: L,D-transpeptidase, partial [Thermoanaerobaculia bacterium]|nr:L,D-transpeptidase [Thermoanaerobaculia bacterium]